MAKHATPKLDQLEKGPWPSFVSDIKQEAAMRAKNPGNVDYQIPVDCPEDLLGVVIPCPESVFSARRRPTRQAAWFAGGKPSNVLSCA